MFSIVIIVALLVSFINSSPYTSLDEYVFNKYDINYQTYKLLSANRTDTHRQYRLNITTLKWFDGKFKILKNLISSRLIRLKII